MPRSASLGIAQLRPGSPTVSPAATTAEEPPKINANATIIEVRSHDRPALLFGLGEAITKCQIDIKSAIVTTLGAEAIDTLYVTEIGGGGLSETRAQEVADRLAAALA